MGDSHLTPGKLFASTQSLAANACVQIWIIFLYCKRLVLLLAMEGKALARTQQPDHLIFFP
jgi:hypothetical protein